MKANLTSGNDESIAIVETTNIWEKFKDGEFPVFENTEVIKESLNDLISCGDKYFEIATVNCTDTDCIAIADTSTWSPPGCTSDSSLAQDMFNDLKNSYDSNFSLMNNMINDLDGTPHTNFRSLRSKLITTINTFEDIEDGLSNTLSTVSSFTEGFNSIADCRIMRKEIKDLESGLCFSVRKNIFMLFVFLSLLTFLLLTMNFCICCTLASAGKKKEKVLNFQPPYNENMNFAKPYEQKV